jgi:hypothetical protein
MKNLIFKTTLFLFAITLYNCEKNDIEDQLPPITQNGANTFGAIIDGRVFVPKTSYTFTPGSSERIGLQVLRGENFIKSNGDDKWIIKANNYKDTPETYIYIYIPTLKNNIKNHILGISDADENSKLPNAHIYTLIDLGNRQYRSFSESGNVTFSKIDITNGIYSGTFSVKLKNKDDENDIIEITDGRFDINLNTVNK